MSRWFRFYDDALNDPKILKLSDKLHRIWIGILCVASKNDGQLPPSIDLALMIRMKPQKLEEAVEELIKAGLIDEEGPIRFPHNWNKRQFKSDVSTERVQRHRNGKGNVSETPPETEQKQITEQKDIPTVAKATRSNDDFESFWKSYPKRHGANPKAPAEKLFFAAVKAGSRPVDIIAGAKLCALAESQKVGTEFIPQAVKWLRDRRWQDYLEASKPGPECAISGFYAMADSEQLAAWDSYGMRTAGKGMPRDKNQGWRVKAEWPPGYDLPPAQPSHEAAAE